MVATEKTPRGHRTEAAFLDAGRRVFAEKGFFNAKITDIAAAAGKSAGSFYNYYDNKEQLLAELVAQFPRDVVRAVLQRPDPSSSPRDTVRAAVAAYWVTYRDYTPEMIGIFHLSMTDDGFRQMWLETRAAGIRAIERDIGHDPHLAVPAGVRPALVASALVSMLEGFCWVWTANGGELGIPRPSDDEAIDLLAHVWCRALGL